jgi:prolyl-tRNA synthetase
VPIARAGAGGEVREAAARLAAGLEAFQEMLLRRAAAFRDSRTAVADSWPAFTAAARSGRASALHRGQRSCEAAIKAGTGATPPIPSEVPDGHGTCVRCGAPSACGRRVPFARAY